MCETHFCGPRLYSFSVAVFCFVGAYNRYVFRFFFFSLSSFLSCHWCEVSMKLACNSQLSMHPFTDQIRFRDFLLLLFHSLLFSKFILNCSTFTKIWSISLPPNPPRLVISKEQTIGCWLSVICSISQGVTHFWPYNLNWR